MNKKFLWVGLLLLGIGAVWYINPSVGVVPTSVKQAGEASVPRTLRGLVTGQESLTCTFSSEEEGMASDGVIYVAGGRMRGDFTSTYDGVTTMSHMMVSDSTSYFWNEGETEGMMMAWSEEDEEELEAMMEEGEEAVEEEEIGGPFDADADVDYKCDSWNVDETMFTLPEGVEFADFEAIMEEAMGEMMEEGMMDEEMMEQMMGGDN